MLTADGVALAAYAIATIKSRQKVYKYIFILIFWRHQSMYTAIKN